MAPRHVIGTLARAVLGAVAAGSAAAAGFGDVPTAFQLWMLAVASALAAVATLLPAAAPEKKKMNHRMHPDASSRTPMIKKTVHLANMVGKVDPPCGERDRMSQALLPVAPSHDPKEGDLVPQGTSGLAPMIQKNPNLAGLADQVDLVRHCLAPVDAVTAAMRVLVAREDQKKGQVALVTMAAWLQAVSKKAHLAYQAC